MSTSPAIVRYARSIISLAIDRNELDAVHEDMLAISNACRDSRELRALLKSPVVKADKKEKILNKIFAGKVGELTQQFVSILVRKGREASLFDVTKAFDIQYKAHKNIKTFEVITAQALDESARAVVMSMAKDLHKDGEVELIEKVDPSLIGGVIIRNGDAQWDGSVSRKLHDLRKELSKNPYIAEI